MLDLIVRAAVGGPCVGPYGPCGCGRSMCWTLWSVRLWEVPVSEGGLMSVSCGVRFYCVCATWCLAHS